MFILHWVAIASLVDDRCYHAVRQRASTVPTKRPHTPKRDWGPCGV